MNHCPTCIYRSTLHRIENEKNHEEVLFQGQHHGKNMKNMNLE